MLDNSIIIINKWYDFKTDYLPKNTITKIEQNEISVDVGNYEVASVASDGNLTNMVHSKILSYKNVTTGFIFEAQYARELSFSTNNASGDTNVNNFGLNITVNIDIFELKKGQQIHSKRTRSSIPKSSNYTDTSIYFTDNVAGSRVSISATPTTVNVNFLDGIQTYSQFESGSGTDYYVNNQNITSIEIKLMNGKYVVSEKKIVFGSGTNSYKPTKNEFIEKHAMAENGVLSANNANNILSQWGNGKQYVEVVVGATQFTNDLGTIIIDPATTKNTFNVFDRVAFKKDNQFLEATTDGNGNPKIFKILQRRLSYSGCAKITLCCLEE